MDGSHSGQRRELNRKDYLGNGRTGKIGQPWFATGHFGRGLRSSLRGGWHIYTASKASRLTNRALPRDIYVQPPLPRHWKPRHRARPSTIGKPKETRGRVGVAAHLDRHHLGRYPRKARGKDVCRHRPLRAHGSRKSVRQGCPRTGNAARRRRSTPLTLLAPDIVGGDSRRVESAEHTRPVPLR
jgi:hypothetical protein